MVNNCQRFSGLIADGDFLMMRSTHGLATLAIHWSFSKSPGHHPMELRNYVRTCKRVMDKAISAMRAMALTWDKEFALEWGESDELIKKLVNEKNNGIEKFTKQGYPRKKLPVIRGLHKRLPQRRCSIRPIGGRIGNPGIFIPQGAVIMGIRHRHAQMGKKRDGL